MALVLKKLNIHQLLKNYQKSKGSAFITPFIMALLYPIYNLRNNLLITYPIKNRTNILMEDNFRCLMADFYFPTSEAHHVLKHRYPTLRHFRKIARRSRPGREIK